MSREERQQINEWVAVRLREVMQGIVTQGSPLIPEALQDRFQFAVDELDRRRAFVEVTEALRLDEEEASERVWNLEASLDRVGLLGPQLALKLSVIAWADERARLAFERAGDLGSPDVLDPEDDSSFDPANPPEAGDDERRAVWRRARKLLAKLLKAIDDLLGSLISAIPHVGELITEVKQALESVLDR
ncbi:hypothetical protein [Streptomyces cucumeris]|uniref:hypothetical protein n=1 Tax=Streptomyces cucumeris TaxID=2962890 RepID=UPI003D72B6B8